MFSAVRFCKNQRGIRMDIEKLGLFYLGKQVDQESGKLTDVPVLYERPTW